MRTRRKVAVLAPLLLAGLTLLAVWICLPTPDKATAAPVPPAPDGTRWLDLVWDVQAHARIHAPEASLTINVDLTGERLAGTASGLQEVTASVLRDGIQIAHGSAAPVPDPGGNFYSLDLFWSTYPCPPSYCHAHEFEPGDLVWVVQGSASISMTVPLLTALAEPLQDSLHGEAPPNEGLIAYILPFDDPSTVYTATGSAAPDGSYSLDLQPAVDLHRQDSGYVLVEPQPGVRAYRYFIAPLLRLQVGGGAISGIIPPETSVYITRTNNSGDFIALYSAYSGNSSVFALDFSDWWDPPHPATSPLSPGDHLLAAIPGQSFSMTVPHLSASTDLESGLVAGQAESGSILDVRRYAGPIYDWPLSVFESSYLWDIEPVQTVSATASLGGDYSANVDLAADDYAAVFRTLADENQAYARTATTSIYARMNAMGDPESASYLVQGQLDCVLTPVTVTLQGPSGYFKDWSVVWTGSSGIFTSMWDYPSGVSIDSGDTLRIAMPDGEVLEMIMPELTAAADAGAATVSGIAPPGSRLTVAVFYGDPAYPISGLSAVQAPSGGGGGGTPMPDVTQVVTASASGGYLADFSADWTFSNNTYGEVILDVQPGYHAARAWNARGCPPSLAGAQVGGNQVFVHADWSCMDADILLRDELGQIKGQAVLWDTSGEFGGWQASFFDDFGSPIPVVPGDVVDIAYAGEHTYTVVPELTVQIDPASNIVSGLATSGERVSIQLKRAEDYPLETLLVVTATVTGTYQADLDGEYAYTTGDRIYAVLAEGPQVFYAITALPRLDIQLYSPEAVGFLPPLSSYTLTFTRALTSTVWGGFAGSDGRFVAYLRDAYANPMPVNSGSQFRLETPLGIESITIPVLSAHLDTQAGQLSGEAPPGASLRVWVSDSDEHSGTVEITRHFTATTQGDYTLDLAELHPLSEVQGTLTYLHPGGHQVWLAFFSPRLQVRLEDACVGGYQTVRGAPGSLSLSGAAGSETIVIDSEINWLGFSACFSRPVQSGDLLVLSDAQGIQMSYRVPLLDAQHDFVRQALVGQAPPGSDLVVVFQTEQFQEITRIPWQESDGSFGIDTSDLSLSIGQHGYVTHTDALGNQTTRYFSVGGMQVFLPAVLLSVQ